MEGLTSCYLSLLSLLSVFTTWTEEGTPSSCDETFDRRTGGAEVNSRDGPGGTDLEGPQETQPPASCPRKEEPPRVSLLLNKGWSRAGAQASNWVDDQLSSRWYI